MFFYLIKLLFSGFLPFKGNFVCGQNNSKYRDWAPLSEFILDFEQHNLTISEVTLCIHVETIWRVYLVFRLRYNSDCVFQFSFAILGLYVAWLWLVKSLTQLKHSQTVHPFVWVRQWNFAWPLIVTSSYLSASPYPQLQTPVVVSLRYIPPRSSFLRSPPKHSILMTQHRKEPSRVSTLPECNGCEFFIRTNH